MSMISPKPKAVLTLSSFFSAADILVNQTNLGRDALIRKMLDHLAAQHQLTDTDKYFNAIIERESSSDTVLSRGIALPHARLESLDKPYVAVATSSSGISFADNKPPVHLILLVLIPSDQPGLYLQIIRSLSSILRDTETSKKLTQMSTPEEVMRFFERGGLVLPDYVCAADIMDNSFDFLRNNDNLKSAIDSFIAKKHSEIPVLDNDDDMVGVVSAGSLLKVCLPDYLLWMSDLSPIINFEPFTDVLRKEQSSSLSDILVKDFPAVQMSAPAISVAAEITRRNCSACYVLNDKKLVGVIDLPLFLNKIFRE
ncbi:MAG: PTS sugar transporter subunit IIA [Kiritimatiellae bacterium]|nr:PTS sugar transporter subunit IIA [Kiritimatiellia bacterium]